GDDQYQGDTSFAAGRFTTQAFETERSFEWGSERPPFDPNSPTSPTSPVSMSSRQEAAFRRTAPESRTPGGGLAPVHEGTAPGTNGGSGINTPAGIESLSLGAPLDEHAIAAPIPEGMSQDLGVGEYDVDREKEWKSFGAAGDAARGGHLQVDRDAHGAESSVPSNFLDFKDTRSGVSETSGEYNITPTPTLRNPRHMRMGNQRDHEKDLRPPTRTLQDRVVQNLEEAALYTHTPWEM
ncbi:3866_t:CDS:2, partial [Acaulospora colombiana]